MEAFAYFNGISHVSRRLNLNPMETSVTTSNDDELLRLTRAGDAVAFTSLYRKHQARIYRFALLMSGSASIAEDVTQEVFLLLIRDAHRYDSGRGSLAGYLYGVARKQVLRHQARDHLHVPLLAETEEGQWVSPLLATDDPLHDCTRREVIDRVRKAVLALPAKYREVVVLCDFQELSYAEAAQILDCAVGTICSRLHRGHALLLERLRVMNTTPTPQAVRCLT